MVMSFFANLGTYDSFPQAHAEQGMELLGFQACTTYLSSSETYSDPFPEPQDIFLSDNCSTHLPYFDNLNSESELFLAYQNPKRLKSCEENHYYCPLSDLAAPPPLPPANSFDGFTFVPNPPVLPDFSFPLPLPDFHSPPLPPPARAIYNSGSVETVKKGGGEGGSLSAQSMAARQRRRKITEKTQELGKLVPGGHKMNTAEMFQAAFSYIKFLQAQVDILQMMKKIIEENNEKEFHSEELQSLASCPRFQEKLYSSEMCLVPKNLVETLISNESELMESSPLILEDLRQVIQS
ncbi:hypothetical protein NMG60_11005195 [Bertholletia excelsa]